MINSIIDLSQNNSLFQDQLEESNLLKVRKFIGARAATIGVARSGAGRYTTNSTSGL